MIESPDPLPRLTTMLNGIPPTKEDLSTLNLLMPGDTFIHHGKLIPVTPAMKVLASRVIL